MKSENIIYSEFLNFEKEKDLFSIEYKSFRLWEYSRMLFYIEFFAKAQNLSDILPSLKQKQPKQKARFISKHCLNFNLKNIGQHDILLMGNPRRIKQHGDYYYDIYTDPITNILKDFSSITIEDPFWGLFPNSELSHYKPITKNIYYLDKIEKKFFLNWENDKYAKYKKDLEIIFKKIVDAFFIEFKYDLSNVIELCISKIIYFIEYESLYSKILEKINPKIIFLFYHPHHSEWLMNYVAQKKGIPVIDIQHGIMGDFEPIWHKFKDKSKNHVLPNYIFSFSKKLTLLNDVILKDKIMYVGYPFLEQKFNEYKDLVEKKHSKKYILFVSQTNIGKKLFKIALDLAKILDDYPEYKILYKLHPYESQFTYSCLEKHNFKIINNQNKDIYFYQAISDIQIGVYSTAIYEGVRFNLSTIIIENLTGGQECLKFLKGVEGVYSAKSAQDIFKIIESSPQKTKPQNSLWTNFSESLYRKKVFEIIKETKKE